eukprot:s1399_g12.t1
MAAGCGGALERRHLPLPDDVEEVEAICRFKGPMMGATLILGARKTVHQETRDSLVPRAATEFKRNPKTKSHPCLHQLCVGDLSLIAATSRGPSKKGNAC